MRRIGKATRLGWSVVWALLFGLVAASAVMWVDAGGRLRGGLAFAINRLPREMILRAGGPDIDRQPILDAIATGVFVFLIACAVLFLSDMVRSGESRGGRVAWSAIALMLLLVYQVGDLFLSSLTRHALGDLRLSFFLPWHLVALGLTLVYLIFRHRSPLAARLSRGYWLTVFALAFVALFPITDAL